MWFLPEIELPIGYIPVGSPTILADFFRIPKGIAACEVLAARYMESVDLGWCDNRYFLSEIRLENTTASVDVLGNFRLTPEPSGTILIKNLGVDPGEQEATDPHDGQLDLYIYPDAASRGWFGKKSKVAPTHLRITQAEIASPQPVAIQVDRQVVQGSSFKVSMAGKKIRFITGRGYGSRGHH
jgi:hypothetical protein